MSLQGHYYPQGSSERLSASFEITEDRFTLHTEAGQTVEGDKGQLRVSDRLGNVERKIFFEQGVFTTSNNDVVDHLFSQDNLWARMIHTVESNLAWVFVALIVTVFSGYGFINYGVPWAGKKIAHMLPHETNEVIAKQSFEFLDEYILSPSHLNEERQEALKTHFEQNLVQTLFPQQTEVDYQLHFRRWGDEEGEIANALALPSGDIIVTDEFVQLAHNQHEIDAVLLHEIGHVVERHSLQMMVQTTMLATVIMMVTGDSSGLADMGVGLGSLLVNSHYSRGHETDADRYAFQKMLELGIDPIAFSNIMTRLEETMSPESKHQHHDEDNWLDYLSTHPATQQRIEQAARFKACYDQGLIQCKLD